MRSTSEKRAEGFTLIEMIVVLAVLGLVGMVVLSRGPMHSPTLELRVAAQGMTAAMRDGRMTAIVMARPVIFMTNASQRWYGIEGRPDHTLPYGVMLADNVTLVFHPDGSVTGRTITLFRGARRITLAANALTGSVTVRENVP
ncbi:general secretion pathway protein H [Komagataeibacter oboediens DSM 11826]|uniref:Prepilin-type cleavage/methylation domain-containing protein n=1 Tax=Komagataeibacter oboediens TaxID=65958 RepID=A0A318QXP8_9PROT|nr:prepilin-type N-terminal cleavage/methylation domain-containing protein [Komagataeibacter oboediens]PYD82132.1 prepilin-type cleavage/methylation domain-containing protein [Komagataeibacter oboediens]GBR36585.1 general secretion pathway protein H [Komagataeibacter oboediens DSM 11826]